MTRDYRSIHALSLRRGARGRGLRVPEDVSVVGSDDSQMMEFADPPLTTVRQPAEALAQAASQEIAEQIAGGATLVLVSHDAAVIERTCERVVVLDHGAVVFDGPTSDGIAFYREEALV